MITISAPAINIGGAGRHDSKVIKTAAQAERNPAFFLSPDNFSTFITRYRHRNIRSPFVKRNEII